jgi:hypothetical protein
MARAVIPKPSIPIGGAYRGTLFAFNFAGLLDNLVKVWKGIQLFQAAGRNLVKIGACKILNIEICHPFFHPQSRGRTLIGHEQSLNH